MEYTFALNLPQLIKVNDYQEFGDLEDKLKQLNRRLRCTEVGFSGSKYVGVVYVGRKPSKAAIETLAQAQKIVLENVEDMA